MALDPGIAALLKKLAASPRPKLYELAPQQARTAYRQLNVDNVTPVNQIPVASVEDVTVEGRPARLYRPHGDEPVPTIVYFHGGGFVVGSIETHDHMCRALCRESDAVVLSIDYRLAPEHPFPAAVDDCTAATQWAADNLSTLGGANVLAVAGDSAGGNLAAVIAQTLRDRIDAQILIYPATDETRTYPSREENGEGYVLDAKTLEWFTQQYIADAGDRHDPRISPMRGNLNGLPKTLVCTAEYDPLRDEGEAYAARLKDAGVDVEHVRYDGLTHAFVDLSVIIPSAASAVDDIARRTKTLLEQDS